MIPEDNSKARKEMDKKDGSEKKKKRRRFFTNWRPTKPPIIDEAVKSTNIADKTFIPDMPK